MEVDIKGVPSRIAKSYEKKKKVKKAILVSVIIFCSLIIVSIIAFIWSVYNKIDSSLVDISLAPEVTFDVNTNQEVPIVIPVNESVKEKSLTMLLLGIDSRSGAGGLNSDVIVLATLNPETKKGYVISMPRDSKVTYTYEGKEYTQKVNSIYADGYEAARKRGDESNRRKLAGMERVKVAVGQFYDVDISYATTVNFQGFKDVVDTLGGIDIYVDMNMRYTDSHDNTNINLSKGDHTLSGKEALDFVRFRKTNTNEAASSDFQRNERQARVIKAMIKKLVSFNGLTKINSVIAEVAEDVSTDMPTSEIQDSIKTYLKLDLDNITFTSLPGNWKTPYVYPDEAALVEAKDAIKAIISE